MVFGNRWHCYGTMWEKEKREPKLRWGERTVNKSEEYFRAKYTWGRIMWRTGFLAWVSRLEVWVLCHRPTVMENVQGGLSRIASEFLQKTSSDLYFPHCLWNSQWLLNYLSSLSFVLSGKGSLDQNKFFWDLSLFSCRSVGKRRWAAWTTCR